MREPVEKIVVHALDKRNYDKKRKAAQGFYAAFSKTTEYFFTAPALCSEDFCLYNKNALGQAAREPRLIYYNVWYIN